LFSTPNTPKFVQKKSHNMKKLSALTALLSVAIAVTAQPKATLSASISTDTLDLYATVTLQYTAENANSPISVPSFADFEVVSGPMETSTYNNINGKVSSKTSYKVTLRPQKTGTFTIQPASVQTPDDLLQTNPLQVVVLQNGILPNPPVTRQPAANTTDKISLPANKPRPRRAIDL
jgi:uncharacterized protein (DUF58 family)